MLTENLFRHAKAGIPGLQALVARGTVDVTEVLFTNSVSFERRNLALFDVIRDDGVMLTREQNQVPEYWFDGDVLQVRTPGNYKLLVYSDLEPFETRIIATGGKIVMSDGSLFKVGIPFWPQVLSQPEHGIARVASDGRNLAYVSQGFTGQVAFSYRMVNLYGQVTEPACVNVTAG